jgi:hypothetical protein
MTNADDVFRALERISPFSAFAEMGMVVSLIVVFIISAAFASCLAAKACGSPGITFTRSVFAVVAASIVCFLFSLLFSGLSSFFHAEHIRQFANPWVPRTIKIPAWFWMDIILSVILCAFVIKLMFRPSFVKGGLVFIISLVLAAVFSLVVVITADDLISRVLR